MTKGRLPVVHEGGIDLSDGTVFYRIVSVSGGPDGRLRRGEHREVGLK